MCVEPQRTSRPDGGHAAEGDAQIQESHKAGPRLSRCISKISPGDRELPENEGLSKRKKSIK